MSHPKRITGHHQHGSALLVSLIILLMVSVLGLSAMRASIFSSKVSTGLQADAMTFEASETVLTSTYDELSGLTDLLLYAAIEGAGRFYCLGSDGVLDGGDVGCGAADTFDSRELLTAGAYTYIAGLQAIEGSQVSISGGGSGVFVDYRIDMLSRSTMDSYSLESNHLQETLKRGIQPAGELE
jgi:hypothetical protein